MNFSDHIIRKALDIVYVRRTALDMSNCEEYNSLLWDIEKIGKDKNLYSVPARAVKIGEYIYNENGYQVAYRCS